jgi:hypothetical protein
MHDEEDQDRQELIAGLNEDLAGEYRVIMGYATVIALLRVEVANRQGIARFLADAIVALGGQPGEIPKPMPLTRNPCEMLEHIRRADAAISKPQRRSVHVDLQGSNRQRLRRADIARVTSPPRRIVMVHSSAV